MTPARRAATIAVVVLTVVGAVLRADQAGAPPHRLSKDEAAYGRLALDLAHHGSYGDHGMGTPLHWAPGAPLLFALADRIHHDPAAHGYRIPAARWAQVVVGTALIPVVAALALVLGGLGAAVLGAAATALYPPLVLATARQLSEPLGALVLAGALLALALALRRPSWPRFALTGALLGATVLVRADLLPLPLVLAVVVAIGLRRIGGGRPLPSALAVLGVAALVMAPWVAYTSLHVHRLVPVSDGGPSTLFVGTFLPGDGTITGLKRRLGPETRRSNRLLRHIPDQRLRSEWIFKAVAERYPGLSERSALAKAARHNIRAYALGRPVAFAGMMLRKAGRMWLSYDRGSGRRARTSILVIHLVLLAAAVLGLVLALVRRRRDLTLWAIAATVLLSTAINAVLIAEPRHDLPLMPLLFAAGAAGAAALLPALPTARRRPSFRRAFRSAPTRNRT